MQTDLADLQPRIEPVLSAPRRIRKRVLAVKLSAAAILTLALVVHDVYEEGSLAELALQGSAFVLLLAAAMGRVWASAHIALSKSRALICDGPYSIVRNPLYFFSFLAHLGAGLAFESLTLALLLGGVFFATHWGTVYEEERWLRGKFPGELGAYFARVPRFLPKPWLLSNRDQIVVAPGKLARAVLESSLVFLVFPLARAVDWCHLQAVLPVVVRLP